jgi:hypothetical protein
MENPNKAYRAYTYVSDALDQLFLLQHFCPLSVKQQGFLNEAEIALTTLLDSLNPDLTK